QIHSILFSCCLALSVLRPLTFALFPYTTLFRSLYCRFVRFREVVRQVAAGGRVDWADVALAGGYYDQAHLAHEFRDFSGMSPSRDRKSTRLNSSHEWISYAVFCLNKKRRQVQ